ncbi:MAG: cell division protein ZapA [Bacteroidetes bacterium]|nr:cell division protein ZapA [Bacteroidota bacterium]HNR18450.1 cell division protein ZapA [Bacteroidia bacterium]
MLKSKMSTSPIKITIAGNDFNLIANKAEEKKLTDAAQMVNAGLAGFDKLQSTGKQMEALTLCSLKLAGEILELRKQLESSHTRNLKHIDVIDSLLDKHLALH